MTMTDTEAKALALVNEVSRSGSVGSIALHDWSTIYQTLCRAIEREAATEARHAAELREQAGRFSEVAARMVAMAEEDCSSLWAGVTRQILAPFILSAPDPLVEAAQEAFSAMLRANSPDGLTEALRAAIEARGGKIVWEAGE